MSTLASDLWNIAGHNKDGAYTTQGDRSNMLQLFANQLQEMGYKLPSARSLKPKHILKLVERWQIENLGAGTIKNRMCGLRWWAKKVNKASIIPRTNEELGIEERQHLGVNKAQKLDMDKLDNIPCERMQLSLRLMSAFGLRMEEAIKFSPAIADKGDKIDLKAGWCKGGRARTINITIQRQRDLLAEIHKVAGNGSLIPSDKNYIQHRKALEHQTLKVGFNNLHGLRHNYAQVRYKMLTGRDCPKNGGLAHKDMTHAQQKIDKEAKLQISQELGHNRIEITKVYLG